MPLPPLSHLLFELGVYALGLVCLWRAWREGPHVVWALLGGLVYGVVLEYVGLHAKHNSEPEYNYGRFLVMLFANQQQALPLCIVAGWALIIHATMRTTKRLGTMPWFLRPLVNATLGLSIDLIMDPVASGTGGLGMWFWNEGLQGKWQGVPLGNFIGWYMVIATFSLCIELGWRLVPPGRRGFWTDLLVVVCAIPASLVGCVITQLAYGQFVSGRPWEPLVLVAMLAAGSALFARYASTFRRGRALGYAVLAVPVFFQWYFAIWLILGGQYRELPGMLIVAPLAIAAGMVAFCWPYARPRVANLRARPAANR